MLKLLLNCSILLVCCWSAEGIKFNHFTTAASAAGDAYKLFKAIKKYINNDEDTLPKDEILNKLRVMSTDFRKVRDDIIDRITNTLRTKLVQKTDQFFKCIKDVQRLYSQFLEFFEDGEKYPEQELKHFAEITTTRSLTELRTTVQKMHETLIDNDIRKESIINIISNSYPIDIMCVTGDSAQQILYNLFTLAVTTHMKGLMMTLHAYVSKEKFEKQNYTHVIAREINNFRILIVKTHLSVQAEINVASQEIWKCIPKKHIEGTTYSKLQVFQQYFLYEPDTKASKVLTIFRQCSSIKDGRLKCTSEMCKAQPNQKRCRGHLRDCQTADSKSQVCHSPLSSDRRYEWLRTESEETYGLDYGECPNYTQGLTKVLFEDVCVCNCESEYIDAPRHFSLMDVTSNVEENKVVTGVKLVKLGNIYYIQIQQAALGENGTIIDDPTWKDVTQVPKSEFDKTAEHHYNVENIDHERIVTEWTDFFKNNYVYTVTYNRNKLYLDSLVFSSEFLLTGLRFKQINEALRLEIQGTAFDYVTGKLDTKRSTWNFNSEISNSKKVILQQPALPIKLKEIETVSDNNEFVHFQTTDYYKDLGQNTVPFLDLQEVVSNVPLPMSGAGFFHKGKSDSGGFLSLKLFHYNISTYL